MIYLTALLALSAGDPTPEPTLEWTLRYMVREIPAGTEEAFEKAADYKNDKKAWKQQASLRIYTVGRKEAMARASTAAGTLSFAVIPQKDGSIRLTASFEVSPGNKPGVGTDVPGNRIRYNEELDLGGDAQAKDDPKKPGHLLKGRAGSFILILRKVDATIPKLAEEAARRRRGK